MFWEKESVGAFHIANLIFTYMVSIGVYAVMTIYVIGKDFKLFQHSAILLLIILPIYLLGHVAFEKYKITYQRYRTTENEKVVVLNQKFLEKKDQKNSRCTMPLPRKIRAVKLGHQGAAIGK
ncbi:hypothetical protein ACI2OX_17245 [Bacillus sp. N9]